MDLESMTVKELKAELEKREVKFSKYLRKSDYIGLLEETMNDQDTQVNEHDKALDDNVTEAKDLVTQDQSNERVIRVSPVLQFARDHYQNVSLILWAILALVAFYDPEQYSDFFVPAYSLGNGMYSHGFKDIYILVTVTLTAIYLRHLYQTYYLEFLANMSGITDSDIKIKFKEAGWFGVYYIFSFILGAYLMYLDGDKWWNLDFLWQDYPQVPVHWLMKFYYIMQIGMWFHCILVIHIEKKRKDYWQMLFHHIVTIVLTAGAWFNGYINVGLIIMVEQDLSDILLYNMKVMSYIGGRWKYAADSLFLVFIPTWIITRHGIFNIVVWNYYSHSADIIAVHLRPAWHVPVFTSCFVVLQVLFVLWFYLILNIAFRYIKGDHVEDSRSDVSEE